MAASCPEGLAAGEPARRRVGGDGRIDRTRRRIMGGARIQFAAAGYAGTTVGEIARVADVSVGSVYLHFASKRELALWYVFEALGALAEELRSLGRVLSPGDCLAAANAAFLRHVQDDPVAYRLWLVALVDPVSEPGCEDVYEAIGQRAQEMAAQVAQDSGLLDGNLVSAELTGTHLLASWTGVASMMVRADGLAVDPRLAAQALDVSIELLTERLASLASRV